MAKAILETSALINLCFWDNQEADKVRSCYVGKCSEVETSPYVLFELSRGFLRYLILFHAKCHDLKDISDVVGFIEKLFRSTYYRGAVIGSYKTFLRSVNARVGMNKEQELVLMRSWLQKNIRRGWKKAKALTAGASNHINCRSIPDPSTDSSGLYYHDLPTLECGKRDNCGLRTYFSGNRTMFQGLRTHLQSEGSPDAETVRRIKSLRQLYRKDNQDFNRQDCFNCADAIICSEAPVDSLIVTKNIKHIGPIADFLGKKWAAFS